jgi:hypothetical protein
VALRERPIWTPPPKKIKVAAAVDDEPDEAVDDLDLYELTEEERGQEQATKTAHASNSSEYRDKADGAPIEETEPPPDAGPAERPF